MRFMLQAEQESAEEEAVGYSPLHAYWSVLLYCIASCRHRLLLKGHDCAAGQARAS